MAQMPSNKAPEAGSTPAMILAGISEAAFDPDVSLPIDDVFASRGGDLCRRLRNGRILRQQ
jgi:hypothetical protein